MGCGAGWGFQLRQSAEAKKKQLAQDAKDRIAEGKKAKKEVCFVSGASSLGHPFCSLFFRYVFVSFLPNEEQKTSTLQIVPGAPLIRLTACARKHGTAVFLSVRAPLVPSADDHLTGNAA